MKNPSTSFSISLTQVNEIEMVGNMKRETKIGQGCWGGMATWGRVIRLGFL